MPLFSMTLELWHLITLIIVVHLGIVALRGEMFYGLNKSSFRLCEERWRDKRSFNSALVVAC